MARYKLDPMPDADRVWWYRDGQPPLMLVRSGDEGYAHERPVVNGSPERLAFYYWHELLAGGEVGTDDPDDVSWLSAGPWRAKGREVLDVEGYRVLCVAGERTYDDEDERLAELIARLVNEHVARRGERAER